MRGKEFHATRLLLIACVAKQFAINIQALAISLIDKRPQELVYIVLQPLNISGKRIMNENQQEVNRQIQVRVEKLQVDNHDYDTPFPVAVATAPTSVKRDIPFFRRATQGCFV